LQLLERGDEIQIEILGSYWTLDEVATELVDSQEGGTRDGSHTVSRSHFTCPLACLSYTLTLRGSQPGEVKLFGQTRLGQMSGQRSRARIMTIRA